MRILLDTHLALWLLSDDNRMPAEGKRMIAAVPREDVYYSLASIWEIAIKISTGKLTARPKEIAGALDDSGVQRLSISLEHVLHVSNLAAHHRDPFDRMLVAQAEVEPLKLLTVDRVLAAYGPSVVVV